MQKNSFRRSAFTLIELLIVVAIIAILAAIAVPNFLEAQTRAKVSRVRADLRTIATAIEARAVDEKGGPGETYTLMRMNASPTFPLRPVHDYLTNGTPRNFNQATLPLDLTTPIAYLTSLYNDPFKDNTTKRYDANGANPALVTDPTDESTKHYIYNNISELTKLTGFGFDKDDLAEYGRWRLVSIGPDREFYGSIGRRVYDPTNGTLSLGDIIRTQSSSSGASKEATTGTN